MSSTSLALDALLDSCNETTPPSAQGFVCFTVSSPFIAANLDIIPRCCSQRRACQTLALRRWSDLQRSAWVLVTQPQLRSCMCWKPSAEHQTLAGVSHLCSTFLFESFDETCAVQRRSTFLGHRGQLAFTASIKAKCAINVVWTPIQTCAGLVPSMVPNAQSLPVRVSLLYSEGTPY